MTKPVKLRLGVIGAGAFAEACHVPGLKSHPAAEVVALCGRRPEYTRALADRFGIPDMHTDFRELCARSDIDAVTIATPNGLHAEHALEAIRKGKHVFCEKPLALDVAQARQMLECAEASDRVHQVGFTFRYNYGVRELRRRIRAGDIGQPFFVRSQYDIWDGLRPDWLYGSRENQALSGRSMLLDFGSHLFDIVRFVLGPIDRATGFTHYIPRQRTDARSGQETVVDADDLFCAWFQQDKGVRGQFCVSRITPTFAQNGYLEIVGTEGALKASLSRGKFDSLKGSGPMVPEWVDLPLPEEAHDGQQHALSDMMHSFVEACLRGRIDPEQDASFVDGLAAQKALAAVAMAQQQMRWVRLCEVE